MSSSTIVQDVRDFLKNFPPFDNVALDKLTELSQHITLKYFEEGNYLFKKETPHLGHFFIVKKGNIHILQDKDGVEILVDACDEGDVFGLRAALGNDHYVADARAAEESLLYTIPIDKFKEILMASPAVATYIAAGFASGASIFKPDEITHASQAHNSLLVKDRQQQHLLSTDTIEISKSKDIITCHPEHSIQEAAAIMAEYNIGSLIIADDEKKPLGIITDSDFRKKVVSKSDFIKDQPVKTIMSSPVKTVKSGLPVAELTLAMVKDKITHLCVTEDGTVDSEVLGVISQRDVVTAQGNNPSVLVKQMLSAKTVDKMRIIRDKAELLVRSYLHQEVGVPFITHIITEINDVMIERAVEISIQKLENEGYQKPKVAFCWMSLGSEGRKEQLLRTDQDTAIIYENPSIEEEEETKKYFQRLGEEVTEILVACGFSRCPANMMASNPQWCQPVSGWEQYFRQWISTPDPQSLLNTTIFFDFRPISGTERLAVDLKKFIFKQIEESRGFLNFLAKNATQNLPPLSFFRSFIVEKSGEHKNEFDIKARAMMPFTDVARLLSYDNKIMHFGSTFERLEEVAKRDESHKELLNAAAMGYEILIRQRAIHGLKNNDSGRYINPNEINKLERQTLRNIFKTIEQMQSMIESKYRLSFMR